MRLILSEQFAGKSLLMMNNAYRVHLMKLIVQKFGVYYVTYYLILRILHTIF
ncbi:hypothetical protein T03_13934 [Trichinella britovi]|uniref:Uncharacterized protein n=1 Tax=Trichinella britovi TaxID=45882 RepID=A0A0V1AKB6_TRIBR|nr:hypothetical protein T03_13934 [Trichinella britovi]